MSVPLDRLYHYLADCVNHDALIYRWLPHGSRKLEDLQSLYPSTYEQMHLMPIMICHDQEPLHYHAWSMEQIKQHIMINFENIGRAILANDHIIEHHAQYHLRSVALHSVANLYDKTLLLHSEKHSTEVEKYTQSNFVPVYYWSHAVIARDWFRYAEHDHQLEYQNKNIEKLFLIYNRAWTGTREYRLFFAEQVVAKDLLPDCRTSFSAFDQNMYYCDHRFLNPKFQINNQSLHDTFQTNNHKSVASADYVSEDYQTTAIEVVLETIFDDSRWHLTEKTLRAIACAQPFILCSTPNSLKYLREYGFETFDGLIDESYDCVQDSHQRLKCIINEMTRLQQMLAKDRAGLLEKLYKISKRNQIRFFSKQFQSQVTAELKTNFKNAMQIMDAHKTGKTFDECIELYDAVPGYSEWVVNNNLRSSQEYKTVIKQVENVQRNLVQ